ncbi:hypothetical protein TRFO_11035 [Tritrichomonas foetus]|uniref:Uncharacterized protein n=1 Tax=Tritrichomonas foetus TaxID=1144522 RepID=A0A1J4J5Y6_9EUKA|nr:hypothetical protein TRFO_11035 [Tritrichomonas foetus]|eukprot:OHS94642.1 hypothetical protein TRFO_11035 [Tritrichomonas foetus]
MKVGFYVKNGKWNKMNMPHFAEIAESHGIYLKRIDLDQDLVEQGPFDLIIHKSIDLFVQSIYFDNKKACDQLNKFQSYIKNNPQIPISNPLNFDYLVISRKRIFNELKKLNFNGDCIVPDMSIKTGKYVIKSDLACGAESAHKFEYLCDQDFNPSIEELHFVQPFFETGDSVIKVYVIGKYTKVNVKKPKNFELNYDLNAIERISDVLRKGLRCELFGYDLIRDIHTGNFYIIDLNSFSGIEVIPGFEEMMIDFFQTKIKAK